MSKVILITGTSSGFGRLTALASLSKGYKTYASMRDVHGKNEVAAAELTRAGAKVIELDVTSALSIDAALKRIAIEGDSVDVLVNNAGIAAAGISESFSVEQLQSMFDVNVSGVFRVTQAVLPMMRKSKSGLIINVGSILGRVTFPFFGLYGASKYAVEAMTESFAYELSQLGIDVTLIQPSAFPTNMYTSALRPNSQKIVEAYGDVAQIPVKLSDTIASIFEGETAPLPSEVATAILALVEQDAGTRPRRVVVGESFGAEEVNEKTAPIQTQLVENLGLGALKSLKLA